MARQRNVPAHSFVDFQFKFIERAFFFASGVQFWLILFVALLTGCKPQATATTQLLAGRTMGTTYSVTVVPSAELSLQQLNSEIEAELSTVNQQMSTYLSDSEISQFNASRSEKWFPVSMQTASVVALAKEVSGWTGGAFDVTVGPLVRLWGFGPDGQPEEVPDAAAIQTTMQSVGSNLVEVRLDPPALRKSVPDVEIDLSAIAKGHGVDRIALLLENLGVTAYFVEIGGEVRSRGTRPDGSPWRIGIERPSEKNRELLGILQLETGCLATSGNYRNFYVRDGKRYTHTIDPREGKPVESALLSASVVEDDCATADALATSMMCLGAEESLRLADEKQWVVLLVVEGSGGVQLKRSQAFERMFPNFTALDNDSSTEHVKSSNRED